MPVVLGLTIEQGSATPLAEQIVQGVRRRIEDRVLRAGMRLPPIRGLAESLGVSRFTVVEAYDRLVAGGWVNSRRGAGFFVAPISDAVIAAAPQLPPVERLFDNADVMRDALSDDPARLKVGAGWLPPGWLDEEGLRRRMRALAANEALHLTGFGPPQGFLPLRQQLTLRLAGFGISAPAERLLLTTGATHALDLVTRTLLKPGDCVFVDDPGYWNLFAALRMLGVRLVGVPRRADGPDVAALASLLAEHKPRLFITHSVLQNPTSSNLSPSVAYKVLQLAAQHDLLLLEDDTYADYLPPTPDTQANVARLAALDGLERVIYVGSFSKTLSANLRVGFVAAHPDLLRAFTDVKLFTAVGTSEFAERLIHDMLAGGHYRKFLDRLRGRLGQAMQHALRLLEGHAFTVESEPVGGMFIWARRGDEDPIDIARQAAEHGIVLAPGRLFRPQLQASPWLRFNAAYMADPRFVAWIRQYA